VGSSAIKLKSDHIADDSDESNNDIHHSQTHSNKSPLYVRKENKNLTL